MQFADGQGLVHIVAGALPFAGMVADPAAYRRKGMGLFKQLKGLFVAAVVDQGDIALNAHMGRAGGLAGRGAALVDGKGTGHALGIEFEGRLAVPQALVELIAHFNGAGLGALPAGRALVQFHVAGPLQEGHLKVSGLALDLLHLGHGEQIDVQMAPGLHQLG